MYMYLNDIPHIPELYSSKKMLRSIIILDKASLVLNLCHELDMAAHIHLELNTTSPHT